MKVSNFKIRRIAANAVNNINNGEWITKHYGLQHYVADQLKVNWRSPCAQKATRRVMDSIAARDCWFWLKNQNNFKQNDD